MRVVSARFSTSPAYLLPPLPSDGAMHTEILSRYQRLQEELKSEASYLAAAALFAASTIPHGMSSPLYLFPTIFGFSNGGHDPGSAANAWGSIMEAGAQAASDTGEMMAFDADYVRRVEEWNLQQSQATEDFKAIMQRIEAQDHAIASARYELALTSREHENAKEILRTLRDRFTNVELFEWVRDRLSSLYKIMFDHVDSLCNKTKATYLWETGQDPLPYFPERESLYCHEWIKRSLGCDRVGRDTPTGEPGHYPFVT
ncbi:MAG TPA: hypothetical protein VIM98_16960 [Dyella sp.]|uniref:Tc toxin subunit A-related protein n=1 Tax=Dyella sp. TaxID=1869338 RepID=UPI002F95C1CD